MRRIILIISIYMLAPSTSWSQPVYKSVDKDGKVTYSSTPPEDAQQIEETGIVSRPTDPNATPNDDIERLKRTTDKLEQDRKNSENQRAKQEAAAAAEEKEKTPTEKPVIQRHRPIIQQPTPPAGGKPTPPPNVRPPVLPVPPSPSPPVAVPLGGGSAN